MQWCSPGVCVGSLQVLRLPPSSTVSSSSNKREMNEWMNEWNVPAELYEWLSPRTVPCSQKSVTGEDLFQTCYVLHSFDEGEPFVFQDVFPHVCTRTWRRWVAPLHWMQTRWCVAPWMPSSRWLWCYSCRADSLRSSVRWYCSRPSCRGNTTPCSQ